MIRVSQSHLNLLELCLRKFQYTYLDQFIAPSAADELERREWGSQFHLRMQQWDLGLTATADEFQQPVEALTEALSNVLSDPDLTRQSEVRRSLAVGNVLLTAVYDLVLLGGDRAQIFDWKTYPKPKQRQRLAQHWQTRLYLFIQAETTNYQPNQISMTYWFVSPKAAQLSSAESSGSQGQGQGAIALQSLTIDYDEAQHGATRQDLTQLLQRLEESLAAYRQGHDLPQVPEELGLCSTCPYALRCGRSPQSPSISVLDVTRLMQVEDIEEIPL